MPTIHDELARYRGALALERFSSRHTRKIIVRVSLFLALLFFVVCMMQSVMPIFPLRASFFFGLGLMSSAVLLKYLLLTGYWNAHYFWGIARIGHEEDMGEGGITYEVAEIIVSAPQDITAGFLLSHYGSMIMLRAGVSSEARTGFIASVRERIVAEHIEVPAHRCMTFEHLASFLFTNDSAFRDFLIAHGVRDELYFGAVAWVSRSYHAEKHVARWWGRDMLGKTHGIGSELSYGIAFRLRQFVKDLSHSTVFSVFGGNGNYARTTIEKIEQVLARTKEANVLLVAEPGVGEMDILATLSREMQDGTSVAAIEGKHIMLFDTEAFLATYGEKQTCEVHFIKLMNEAAYAGNLVLVIEHVDRFLESGNRIGVDLESLMDPYLSSTNLQVIATVDPGAYHQVLEVRPRFMQRFAPILIETPPLEGTVQVLEGIVPAHEQRENILFTYAALLAIAEGAERYIVEGVMPDKAVDLLVEIAAAYRGRGVLGAGEVQAYMKQKTGIPMGAVSGAERDTLMNLETTLHQYVVGQNAAIDAVADAMRRARADVGVKTRPMGSFLFLGPTGVGKTETAKALARVFFGDETKMLRVDMSEYNGPDALTRLMGTTTSSGTLTALLHEHPYGVLLLDEFEKGTREVHDLFLQILDEGMFTDARGQKVNARNAIIIATSNAGSDMLFEMVKQGVRPQEHKDEIIAHIVERNIYRPELINRFDGTIIFEPLTREELHHIARMMLKGLSERMRQKGYLLPVTEELVSLLVERGYDPAFGVRPMRRALQDTVEGKIAEKIISGGLRPGDTISFSTTDFVR